MLGVRTHAEEEDYYKRKVLYDDDVFDAVDSSDVRYIPSDYIPEPYSYFK